MATAQEAIRRLTIVSDEKGVSETTEKLKQLGQAQDAVSVSSQRQEKAVQSMEKRLVSIQKQYDLNYRAEQAMTKIERDLNAAQAQGLLTTARKNELLALAAERHGQATIAARAQTAALRGLDAASAATGLSLGRFLVPLGLAAGAALGGKNFLSETIEQQKSLAQLEAVIRSTGGAAGYSANELESLGSALQKVTTFSDEAIVSSEALLLTYTHIGHDIFPRAEAAILDVATAMHTDLDAATRLVGRALDNPIRGLTALTRAGITFTATQQQQIKAMVEGGHIADAQGATLKQLEARFAGSAAAARDTLGGALAGLKNSFGELFEVSGPGADKLTKSINTLTNTLSDPKVMEAIQNFGANLFGAFSGTINLLTGNPWLAKILAGAAAGAAVGGVAGAAVGAVGVGGYELGYAGANAAYNAVVGPDQGVNRSAKGAFGGPAWDRSSFDMSKFYDSFGPTFGSKPGGKDPTDDQIREIERLQKEFDKALVSTQKQTDALRAQAGALGLGVGAAAEYTKQQELLNLATVNHIKLSPADIANIDRLAKAYGDATQKLAEMKVQRDLTFQISQVGRTSSEQQVASTLRGIYGDDFESQMNGTIARQIRLTQELENSKAAAMDFVGGFIGDIRNGTSALDALGNALNRLADKLIDMALDQAISSLFGSLISAVGGGASFPTFSSFRANGGYISGPGTGRSDSITARVSNGEYIVNAEATAKHRALLEAINNGFASGGFVGRTYVHEPHFDLPTHHYADGGYVRGGSSGSATGPNISVQVVTGGGASNDDIAEAGRVAIKQALDDYDRRLPDRVKTIAKNTRRRGQ